MGAHSHRGQVLIEVLVTVLFFLGLTAVITSQIQTHQYRVRKNYQNHEVNHGYQKYPRKTQRLHP